MKKKAVIVVGLCLGLALVGAIGFGVMRSVADADAGARAAERFFAALRAADVDGAYAELSTARRRAMSRAAFAALVDHPAFARHVRAELRPPQQRSPGLCTRGTLHVGGPGEGPTGFTTQVFVVRDADGSWRVESFAIQPPTEHVLGVLLEECGFTAATLVGYSGPPIERSTTRLPR